MNPSRSLAPGFDSRGRLQEKLITVNPQTILVDEKDWTTFQRLAKCSQALGSATK